MAEKKVMALAASTAPASADLAHIITDVSTTPTNKKVTLANFFNKIPTYIGLNSIEALAADGVMSVSTAISTMTSASATCQTTLAASTVVGQIKIIAIVGYSNACDVDVTTTWGAGVTYTFSAVGESLTLMNTGAGWIPLAFAGNAVATGPAFGGSPGAIAIT